MEKIIITLIVLGLLASLPLASAITLESGTIISPTNSNTTYTLGNNLSFSNVVITNVTPYFNDSIFQMEADSGNVAVTINTLTSFSVTATDDVTFTLGGFTPDTRYGIYVDGAYWEAVTANISGIVSFTYSLFSTHLFSFGNIPLSGPGSGAEPLEVLEVPETSTPGADTPFPLWIILCIFISIIILILFVLTRKKSG